MSSYDGSEMDMDNTMGSDDIPLSPTSAADMLKQSRIASGRTLTSTPAKKLFPGYIDIIAPGMTPTSKNQRKRKSQASSQTPRKSARLSTAPSSGLMDTPGPSSRYIKYDTRAGTTNAIEDDMQLTPTSTPLRQSSPMALPRTPRQPVGKRKARESDDSTGRILTFGGWGSGREESPMEMLRRLAQAPGQLSSPIDERSVFMPGISEIINRGRASGERVDLQFEASTSKRPPPRHSVINTSISSSEVGQGRRAARQSARNNIFSDLLQQDITWNHIFLTNRKSDAFTLREDLSNMPIEEESNTVSSHLIDATNNREEELERRIANESTRHVNGFNTSPNRTNRLENLSASFDQDDNSEMPFETGYEPRTPTRQTDTTVSTTNDQFDYIEQDNDRTIITGERPNATMEENERQYVFDQADQVQEEENEADLQSINSDISSEEEEVLDQSKEVRAARMALLRRRRARKKAKRVSSITGNAVPSLPSDLVKSLFATFTTPNAAVGPAPVTNNKSKIKVEKAAAEAVEDLSHLFFAQFSQALITQAEETGKTKIMEKDIVSLMKSQGQISSRNTLPFLARRYLPRELSDLITSTISNENVGAAQRNKSSRRIKSSAQVEEIINEAADTTQMID